MHSRPKKFEVTLEMAETYLELYGHTGIPETVKAHQLALQSFIARYNLQLAPEPMSVLRYRTLELYAAPFCWNCTHGCLLDAKSTLVGYQTLVSPGRTFAPRATLDTSLRDELVKILEESGATAAPTGEAAANCLTEFWSKYAPT